MECENSSIQCAGARAKQMKHTVDCQVVISAVKSGMKDFVLPHCASSSKLTFGSEIKKTLLLCSGVRLGVISMKKKKTLLNICDNRVGIPGLKRQLSPHPPWNLHSSTLFWPKNGNLYCSLKLGGGGGRILKEAIQQ